MSIRYFLSRSPKASEIWTYFTLSCIFWLLILNRWAVTPIRLKSYGRIWQNQISYFELGFIKRAFWGTFLSITGLNKIPSNEYVNAYIIHGAVLLAISLAVAIYLIKNASRLSNSHAIISFSSPAFLSFLAYSLGTLDVVVTLLLTYSCLFVRQHWRLGLIGFAGVLIHES